MKSEMKLFIVTWRCRRYTYKDHLCYKANSAEEALARFRLRWSDENWPDAQDVKVEELTIEHVMEFATDEFIIGGYS